jgi:signal transduction histidine kinase/ligand-binding sensor domain-containing protein
MYQAKNGAIWLGSPHNGIDRLDPSTNRVVNYAGKAGVPNALSHHNINGIAEDPQGNIWVATAKGLNCLSALPNYPDSMLVTQYLPNTHHTRSLSHHNVLSMCSRKNGSIWAGTKEGLHQVIRLPNGTVEFKRFLVDKDRKNNSIEMLYEDQQQRLWVTTARNFGIFNPTSGKFASYAHQINHANVYCILQDKQGILWVGTTLGLYWFDKTQQQFIRFESDSKGSRALYETTVMSLCEDKEGNLWVGTAGNGVYMIDRTTQKFALYTPFLRHPTRQPTQVSCWHISPGKANSLWLRTNKGELVHFDPTNDRISQYKHNKNNPNSLSHPVVRSLYRDTQDKLWVGTMDGLNLFIPAQNQFKRYYPEKTKQDNPIHNITETPQGELLVNVGSEWLYKYVPDTDAFVKYVQLPIKQKHRKQINAIYTTPSGMLWLGTPDGLIYLNPHTRQHRLYDESSGLKANSVLDIYQDKANQIWFTSYGGGLSKLINTEGKVQFKHYGKAQGLLNEFVYGIEDDHEGNLWMSHDRGISKFDPTTEKFTNYTVKEGIQDGEFNQDAFCKRKDGQLLFGGTKGINAFYPTKVQPNGYIPPLVLTNFQVSTEADSNAHIFEGNIGYVKKLTLNHQQARGFSFEFVALNFAGARHNQYKVKLERYDKTWHHLGNRNFVSYTNIPPGKYTFRVQGSNNDGVWNPQELTVEVVILPAWWQTWWFTGSWIGGLGLLLLSIYLLRVNGIKRQKKVLEQTVKERTSELQNTNEELKTVNEDMLNKNTMLQQKEEEIRTKVELIAQQRDNLGKALHQLKNMQTQLVQAEKMASLGQLTAGIAHEINNPINFVSANIRSLKEGLHDIMQVVAMYETLANYAPAEAQAKLQALKQEVYYQDAIDEIEVLVAGIKEGAQRTTEIVRGLRVFSRLDEDVLKETNLHENIDSTLMLLHSEYKDRITIEKDYASLPRIECYPGKLNQVLMNLLANAIQAIEGKGTIKIATTLEADNQVLISIADSGKGMDMATQQRIFEPFFTTKDVGEGTGLGLSIALGIVEAHRGRLTVESEVGVGTCFRLKLPIKQKNE